MMRSTFILAVATAACVLAATATRAQPVNLGFETGDLTGWTAFTDGGGDAGAVTSYGAFTPYSGRYLGFVQAGCGTDTYCTLSQTFSLTAGETISGVVGFQANDYLPFDDYADLNINGDVLFSSNVGTVGDFGNSGWVPWSYTAPTAGSYTLTLEVANSGDDNLPSGAVLDSGSPVPEPSTWAMMLIGFAGLGFAGYRASRRTVVG